MSDKLIQNNNNGSLEQFLDTAPNNPQALLLSAYLEKKKEWEEMVKQLTVDKIDHIKTITNINIRIETAKIEVKNAKRAAVHESKFIKFFNSMFGLKTKKQKLIIKLEKEIEQLWLQQDIAEKEFRKISDKFNNVASHPPPADRWELAMMGNKLFSTKR